MIDENYLERLAKANPLEGAPAPTEFEAYLDSLAQAKPRQQERLNAEQVFRVLDDAGFSPRYGKGGAVVRFTPPDEWRSDGKHKSNWWVDVETGRMYTNLGSVASLSEDAKPLHASRAVKWLATLTNESISRETHIAPARPRVPDDFRELLLYPDKSAELVWQPFTHGSADNSNFVERELFRLCAERCDDPAKWGFGFYHAEMNPYVAAGRYFAAECSWRMERSEIGEFRPLTNVEFYTLAKALAMQLQQEHQRGIYPDADLLKLAIAGGKTNAFHVVMPAHDPADGQLLSCFFWNPFYKSDMPFFDQLGEWESSLLDDHDSPAPHKRLSRHEKYKVLSDAKSRMPKAKCVFCWPQHVRYQGELVWLVEGTFDAISLCEAGIPAVSTWTCQLQKEQLAYAFDRLRPRGFVLAFDSDAAGQHGQESALRLARECGRAWGFEVYSRTTGSEHGKDAADLREWLLRKHGSDREAAHHEMRQIVRVI